jgi:hypothetical protein
MTPFHRDPTEVIMEKLIRIRRTYPDVVKPYTMYCKSFAKLRRDRTRIGGITQAMLQQVTLGSCYIHVLKQTAIKGYSARAASTVNAELLPEKSFAHKSYNSLTSNSAVKIGEYDMINMFVVASTPFDYALFTQLYRTSTEGRNYLLEKMFFGDKDETVKLPKSFKSNSVELLNVYLKTLGRKIIFTDPIREIKQFDMETIRTYHFIDLDEHVICTELELRYLAQLSGCFHDIRKKLPILMTDKDLLKSLGNEFHTEHWKIIPNKIKQLAVKNRRYLERDYTPYTTRVIF